MAACTKVLDTYEPLENILLYLPLSDLLLAERVSKQFQGIIRRSQGIGQALFRAPTIASTTMMYTEPDSDDEDNGWYTEEGKTLQHPIMNPFVMPLDDDGDESQTGIRHDGFIDLRHNRDDSDRVDLQTEAFFRKQASWKTMLMLQPPPREVTFICMEFRNGARELVVKGVQGVTLNAMRLSLVEHWQDCPNCPMFDREQGEQHRWMYSGDWQISQIDKSFTGWKVLHEIRRRTSAA